MLVCRDFRSQIGPGTSELLRGGGKLSWAKLNPAWLAQKKNMKKNSISFGHKLDQKNFYNPHNLSSSAVHSYDFLAFFYTHVSGVLYSHQILIKNILNL